MTIGGKKTKTKKRQVKGQKKLLFSVTVEWEVKAMTTPLHRLSGSLRLRFPHRPK